MELPAKTLFRPDEVACLAQRSRRTIYRLMRRGTILGVRKPGGGPLWVPRDQVVALLQEMQNVCQVA